MPRLPAFFPLAAVIPVLALAGCGSSSPSASSSNASDSSGAASANATKFASCMRQNGVPNFPDPSQSGGRMQLQASRDANGQSMSVDGVPVNAPAFRTASKKCAKYQPKGQAASPSQLASMRSKALKMAQCMRSSGVPNFPDPTVSTTPSGGAGIRIGGGPSKLDPNSPAFKSAMQKCSSEFNIMKGSKGGVGG